MKVNSKDALRSDKREKISSGPSTAKSVLPAMYNLSGLQIFYNIHFDERFKYFATKQKQLYRSVVG